MGLIPQHFIQELLTRVDIVDLIDSRIPLKKAGANYKACCPFHGEKTPSFNVSQDKQFYHCFGCGLNGNAISFLMEYDRLEFPDAVEELALSMGMEVPREQSTDNRPKIDQDLYSVMEKVSDYYQQQLRKPHGKVAIEYLKNRGLSGEIAKEFGIGFVPDEWNNLENHFGGLSNKPQLKKQLVECGMLIQKDQSSYDRFRGRIMFPIKDKRGRVIAFGGRILDQGEPKYLNSPETPVFHKSHELYGLYQARQANRKLSRLLIVEGYMDVVALAQFDIRNAVATLGTATTQTHIQQLFRATRELVLCFDGDRAGREAAQRALDHGLPQLRDGREIKLMFLPDGEDPDSMVRKIGKEAFEQLVTEATPIFDFVIQHLSAQVDLSTISGRGQLVHLSKPYLEKVTDPIYFEFFSKALADTAQLSEEKFALVVSQAPEHKPRATPTKSTSSPKKGSKTIQLALTLVLQKPQIASKLGNSKWLNTLDDPGVKVLSEVLEIIRLNPNINTGSLLEHWRGHRLHTRMSELARVERGAPFQGIEAQEFMECMTKLLSLARKQRLDMLQEKAASKGLSNAEKSEYQQLISRNAQST